MVSAYVLDLSLDAVRLLKREETGLALCGTVSLSESQIGARLADLRDSVQPEGALPVDIVIPDVQILYLQLKPEATSRREVEATLRGATPYRSDELAWSVDYSTGTPCLAATTRQTLLEAATFATEHGFAPTRLIARPTGTGFPSELVFPSLDSGDRAEAERTRAEAAAVTAATRPSADASGAGEERAPSEPSTAAEAGVLRAEAPAEPAMPGVDAARAAASEPGAAAGVEPPPGPERRDEATPLSENEPELTDPVAHHGAVPPDPGAADIPQEPPAGAGVFASLRERSVPSGKAIDPREGRTRPIRPRERRPQDEEATETRRGPPRQPVRPRTFSDSADSEADALTLFGARGRTRPRRRTPVLVAAIAAGAVVVVAGGLAVTMRDGGQPAEVASTGGPRDPVATATDDGTGREVASLPPRPREETPPQDTPPRPAPDETRAETSSPATSVPEQGGVTEETSVADEATESGQEGPTTVTVVQVSPETTEASGDAASERATEARSASASETTEEADLPPDPLAEPAATAASGAQESDRALAQTEEEGSETAPEAEIAVTSETTGAPSQSPSRAGTAAVTSEPDQLAQASAPQPESAGSSAVEPGDAPSQEASETQPAGRQQTRSSDAASEGAQTVRLTLPDLGTSGPEMDVPPSEAELTFADSDEPVPSGGSTTASLRDTQAGRDPALGAEGPGSPPRPRPEERPVPANPNNAVAGASPSTAPINRPTDFAALARQAQTQASGASAGSAAVGPALASTAPAGEPNVVVEPPAPSPPSVAEEATLPNAIRVDQLNLIGVYGSSSNRRALIRLPTGRYQKVQVGDGLDGGRVAAIEASQVRYVKNGQSITLAVPQG